MTPGFTLVWVAEGRRALMLFSELLFFATALMVPGFAALASLSR